MLLRLIVCILGFASALIALGVYEMRHGYRPSRLNGRALIVLGAFTVLMAMALGVAAIPYFGIVAGVCIVAGIGWLWRDRRSESAER